MKFVPAKLLILLMPGLVMADTDAPVAAIDTISVFGTRGVAETSGSAQVLTTEELEKFEHANVHSILRAVPGLYLREEDGNGFFPRIGIRASSSGRSDRISILEDGVPAAMAPYANTSAYFFPNAGRMSSVEVLKGPETLLHGPQTTSGAINLISTPIPLQRQGFIQAELAGNEGRQLHAHFGDTRGQWGYLLETWQRDTEGHLQLDRSARNSGIDAAEYIAKLRWSSAIGARFPQQLDMKIQSTIERANVSYLGLTDADYRADSNRRYGLSELEHMNRSREGFSLQHRLSFADHSSLTTTLYEYETRRIYDRLNQINEVGIGATGVAWEINNNGANAASLQGILDGDLDTTHPNGVRYGANHQAYDATGLQVALKTAFSIGVTEQEVTLAARRHRDITHNAVNGVGNSIYHQVDGELVFQSQALATPQRGSADASAIWLANRISFENLTLVPILRYENIESAANLASDASPLQQASRNRNRIQNTTAGLGATLRLNNSWTLIGGVHQGFAPPGNGVVMGSKGEESTNLEGGVRVRGDRLTADLIAFYSDYDNALRNCLVASPCASGAIDGTEQAGAKQVYGLEVALTTELYEGDNLRFPAKLSYTYTGGEYTRSSDLVGGVQKGDVLDYTPENIASLEIGAQAASGVEAWLAVAYSDGSCVTTECGRTGVDTRYLRTQSLLTLDFALTYPLRGETDLYAKIDNLLDQQRITHRGSDGARGNAPRTAAIGVRMSF